MGWFRGDCHVHSTHSDGSLTPFRLAVAARDAGLDFVATTEHNNADGHAEWTELASDDLLVILGEEVTTATGHWLALGLSPGRVIDWRYRARDMVIGKHVNEVRNGGGIAVAAHPYAPYRSGELMYPFEAFDAIEVWNGSWTSDQPWNADNEAAVASWGQSLASDRWRPAMGGSDCHLNDQIGLPHTVVRATSLSTGPILDGLRAGHSWLAASQDVGLRFMLSAGDRRATVGEFLETEGEPVTAFVSVRGVPAGSIRFLTDEGKVCTAPLPESETVLWKTTAEESAFVRVEVRYADGGMAAMTNPIMLN